MGRKRKSSSFEPEERKNSTKKTTSTGGGGTGGGGVGAAGRCDALRSNSANERERARMRVLSKAFVRLKTSLPWVPPDTKLSKLDTLRLASRYIAHLRRMLAVPGDSTAAAAAGASDAAASSSDRLAIGGGQGGGRGNDVRSTVSEYERMLNSEDIHPMNLSWPFTSNLRKSALQSQNGLRTTTTSSSSSSFPSTTTTATPSSSASSNVSSSGDRGSSFP